MKPRNSDSAQSGGSAAVAVNSTAVQATVAGALAAGLGDELARDSGKGVSTLARDNIIPLIYVLQALSPQVNKRGPAYIEGAEAGMFWLRNSVVELVSGDEGFAFQPCHYRREIMEFIPRDAGGGYVGRHSFITPDEEMADAAKRLGAKAVPSENARRPPGYMLGEHELQERRNYSGFVYGGFLGLADHPGIVLPFVIPFGGTGHTVARGWMTMIGQHPVREVLPTAGPEQVLPSWTRLYQLTTRPRKNSSGEWAAIEVKDSVGWVPGFPDKDLGAYRRGQALHDAIERGEKTAETPTDADAGGEGSASSDDRAARAGV